MITKFELYAKHGRIEAIMNVWLYEPQCRAACTELAIRFDNRGIFADASRTLNISIPTFTRDEVVQADEWLEEYVIRVDAMVQSHPELFPPADPVTTNQKEISHD